MLLEVFAQGFQVSRNKVIDMIIQQGIVQVDQYG